MSIYELNDSTPPDQSKQITLEVGAGIGLPDYDYVPSPEDMQAVDNSVPSEPVATQEETGKRQNWLLRHWRGLAIGAFVGGVAVDLQSTDSLTSLGHKVLETAPWAVTGLGVTEAMWVGGVALAAIGAGLKIGNPLTLPKRWSEVSHAVGHNPAYKAGLAINALGALGTAGVLAAATVKGLPPEAWPGAFPLIAADVAQTISSRLLLAKGLKTTRLEKAKSHEVSELTVRNATQEDIGALAALDLRLFKGAYGDKRPAMGEVITMLSKRLDNNPDGMFVVTVGDEPKGFVTAFRTNVPVDEFRSWEQSTANGSLEGVVERDGKYLYIANLTVDTRGAAGATDMLLARVVAQAVGGGVEYGYFCSRIPGFRRWAEAQAKESGSALAEGAALHELARQYASLTRKVDNKGKKMRPYDPELSMYESRGFERVKLVPGGFSDYKSMGYEVLFKAAVPGFAAWTKNIKPLRLAFAAGIRKLASHPRLLGKLL